MQHLLQCSCGKVKGIIENPDFTNRGICYCKDCQAFAHFLGLSSTILDSQGGTDIIQTTPRFVRFTDGLSHLACMRLTSKGLFRWYASCCRTPIGNTPPTHKLSFVGLIHNCLENPRVSLDSAFGSPRMRVHTKSAQGHPKPKQQGAFGAILRFIFQLLRVRLNGTYRQNPLFDATSGNPIVAPTVLPLQERKTLADRVEARA